MNLYLLKEAELTLKPHHPESKEDKDDLENAALSESEEPRQEGGYWLLNYSVATKLEPLDAENSFQNEFCMSVKALLESLGTEDVTAEGDGDRAKKKMKKSMDWNVSLGIKIDYDNHNKDSVSVFVNGRVLDGLHQISVPHKRVTVRVILKDFVHAKDIPSRNSNNGARWAISKLKNFTSTSTKEMKIIRKKKWAGCCDNALKVPLFQSQQWADHLDLGVFFAETTITAKFSIQLTFHNFNQDNVFFPIADMQRKVLENGFGTDVIICSGDGEEFHCHKNILAVNSPVLERILSSGFEEARSGRIDAPHMTGEAVKTMIYFFYCRDLTAVSGNPRLAMELLEAGEKYDILHLKKAMVISLTLMNEESWTADFALRLYLFAGKIDLDGSGEGLKKKTVGVMKKSATDVKNSQEFRELFKNQPDVAFELFQNMCEEEPKK